jgi:hypothetical protein
MRIDILSDAPLQSVPLPAEVYQGVTQEGLRDLRVFNAAGQVVPHVVVSATEIDVPAPRLERVPAYSLATQEDTVEAEQPPAAATPPAADTDEDPGLEGVLGLDDPDPGPASYLIDASAVDGEISGLRLFWDESASFMSVIAVESSDDLLSWEPWSEPVTVAGLRGQEVVLTRNEIGLPARRASYIRLIHSGGSPLPLPALTHAEVELDTGVDEGARQWWRPGLVSSEGNLHTFELAAWVTVDSMRLVMPAGNALAEVTLASATGPNRGWQERFAGLFYRLEGAQTDQTASFVPVSDRYWRLALSGLRLEEVTLELGQIPERLVFLARGEGPYTLAYGSALVGEEEVRLSSLSDLRPLRDGDIEIVAASLGAPFELGGESRLVAPGAVRLQFTIFIAALLAVLMVTLIFLRRRLERRRSEPATQ